MVVAGEMDVQQRLIEIDPPVLGEVFGHFIDQNSVETFLEPDECSKVVLAESLRVEIAFFKANSDKQVAYYCGTIQRVRHESPRDCFIHFDDGDKSYFQLNPDASALCTEVEPDLSSSKTRWNICRHSKPSKSPKYVKKLLFVILILLPN